MNVYSELLDLFVQKKSENTPAIFGTLSAVSPLTVTLRGTALTQGLFYPAGTRFQWEDVGKELLLLPCEGGLYIMGFVEGGEV